MGEGTRRESSPSCPWLNEALAAHPGGAPLATAGEKESEARWVGLRSEGRSKALVSEQRSSPPSHAPTHSVWSKGAEGRREGPASAFCEVPTLVEDLCEGGKGVSA